MDRDEADKLDTLDKDLRDLEEITKGERHVKSLNEQAKKGILENTMDTILGENDAS